MKAPPTPADDGTAATVFVTYQPETRSVRIGGRVQVVKTEALAAVQGLALGPGADVCLLPGTYWPPIGATDPVSLAVTPAPLCLRGLQGRDGAPIVLRGQGQATQLMGAASAVPLYPELPEQRHFAFIQIVGCAHVTLCDMAVAGCWPCFVYIEDSHHITIRGITATDGLYLVFARQTKRGHCAHLMVEACRWTQDPSGQIWRTLDFDAVHDGDYRFYNGGLFGAEDIAGAVVIRGNEVRDAFNGVRIVSHADGTGRDVEITGNRFLRIRDNAVEPEAFAENWLIAGNSITDCHAWFSFDGVKGGWRHVLGNVGHFTEAPGPPHQDPPGGRVLKFDEDAPSGDADRPGTVAHNSFHTRSYFTKEAVVRGLRVRNNVVVVGRAARDKVPRPTLTQGFLPTPWPDDVTFDGDASNLPFQGPGAGFDPRAEKDGVVVPDLAFRDPGGGDFTPKRPLPLAAPVIFRAGIDWPAAEDWPPNPPAAVTRGAVMPDGTPWQGPPFHDAVAWDAPARIVRVTRAGGAITLVLSRPLLRPWDLTATVALGGAPPRPAALSVDGRRLRVQAAAGARLTLISDGPAEIGQWACPDPLVVVAERSLT